MALLVAASRYWRGAAAADESIDEATNAEQIVQRADQRTTVRRARGALEVGPFGRDQRFVPVWKNEHELQVPMSVSMAENF